MKLKKWNTLSRETIYTNDHWSYNLDKFEIEGGYQGDYHFVHTLGSTLVVPFLNSTEIILVNQYRYLNQRESIEFPCGSVETGLTVEENAIKELREETGYNGKIELVGSFSPYSGVADEMCSVFIATELYHQPLTSDATEEMEILTISISEFEKLIKQNVIWDGMSLAAWIIIKNHLNI